MCGQVHNKIKRTPKTTTGRRDKKVKEKQMRGKVHKQTRHEWDKMQDKCEILTQYSIIYFPLSVCVF